LIELAQLPFSQACENNQRPILDVLKPKLTDSLQLLEVGSGTGQHATFFAHQLPHLTWQASDQHCNINHINCRINHFKRSNLPSAIALDISQTWPTQNYDAVFTANTLHIVNRQLVEAFFAGVAKITLTNANLFIYGPFNYQKQYTSDSNANFDIWLKQRDPQSGIRDIEWIVELANAQQFELVEDVSMPANNRLLHFIKR